MLPKRGDTVSGVNVNSKIVRGVLHVTNHVEGVYTILNSKGGWILYSKRRSIFNPSSSCIWEPGTFRSSRILITEKAIINGSW